MNTLVIIVHPNMDESKINKRWLEELNKHQDKFTVHDLYQVYPDEKIDVVKEQKLIESFDCILFQFPFYWFNCTPLLKKWLDVVLSYGWAYGSKSGYKMANKKIGLAISVGIDEEEYSPTGKYKYSLEHLLSPFELTFEYIKADYKGFFAYYGIEQSCSEEWIEKSVSSYLDFVGKI
ncbi:NAD(P)H-dependent oxidoreductase [Sphingobacterium sp. SRCM116780]|uniref:NAD(P)H-dependent oxidoreductase n=1 Tax=Sphingobacterium sp. SRCM116780 TaxID=2907623 RepID=UPI001F1E888A|nr:NAD(P)H-dependent oxidoreductase [Sphingobacterium sp. SRCM116780]UIR54808.1 NAD(P)H-dependent oxidoreductase [Sphingobacterium sp. SRCM116780]